MNFFFFYYIIFIYFSLWHTKLSIIKCLNWKTTTNPYFLSFKPPLLSKPWPVYVTKQNLTHPNKSITSLLSHDQWNETTSCAKKGATSELNAFTGILENVDANGEKRRLHHYCRCSYHCINVVHNMFSEIRHLVV